MRVISTRDIFGAARDFIDGSPENWDGGDADFSDLSEGVDGISPEEILRDGSAPVLRVTAEDPPLVTHLAFPVRKALVKGKRLS